MPKASKKNSTASLRKTSPAGAPARPIADPSFPNPAGFMLPTGILQQDVEVIDDQEDHIVLTLRVPKENNSELPTATECALGDGRRESTMTDDEIEGMVRDLIEEHLDEDDRAAAIEWLDKVVASYQANVELGSNGTE